MFQKILFIPRALADLLKVLLHKNISFAERLSIAKALGKLKIASLHATINEPYKFLLGKNHIHCLYNKNVGFLLKEIFADEVYSVNENATVKSLLDLGANIGLSVAYFKTKFPSANIECYEPDENSFELLQKNVNENSWENVKCYRQAVSNQDRFLYAAPAEEMASVNSQFSKSGTNEKNKVPSKDIAVILQQKFDVVKMDIEGAEWSVFKRIIEKKLIRQTVHWFVEFHKIENNRMQFEEILNCFEHNGYKREERKEVFYFYKNI
jgi:FkbM family methyltransferase